MNCSLSLPDVAGIVGEGPAGQGLAKDFAQDFAKDLQHVPVVSSFLSWLGATSPSIESASSNEICKDFLGLDGKKVQVKEASTPGSEQSCVDEDVPVADVQGEVHADKIAAQGGVCMEFFGTNNSQRLEAAKTRTSAPEPQRLQEQSFDAPGDCPDIFSAVQMIMAQYLEEKARDTESEAERTDGPPAEGPKRSSASLQCSSDEGRIKVRVKAKDLKGSAADKHKEYKAGAAQSKQLLIRDAAVYFEERRITVKLVDNERGFWSLHKDLPGPINVEESRFSVAKTGEGIDITLKKKAGKWPAQVKLLKDQPTENGLHEKSKPSSPASSAAFLMME